MQERRGYHILGLVLVFLLFLSLRVPQTGLLFWGDENAWPFLVDYQLDEGFNWYQPDGSGGVKYWIDMPLTGLVLVGWAELFGFGEQNLRSLFIVIGLANLALTYLVGRELFGRKSGLLATFFVSVMPWSLFTTHTIDRDASFLTLALLASAYIYLRKNDLLGVFLIGLISAATLFVKTSAALIILIIAAHRAYTLVTREVPFKWREEALRLTLLAGPYVLAYLAFTIGLRAFNPDFAASLFSETLPIDIFAPGRLLFGIVRESVYLLLWATPLFPLLSIAALARRRSRSMLLALWLVIPLGVYSLFEYAGAIDRYLTIIIPALCILSAAFLTRQKFNKTHAYLGITLFVAMFLLLRWLDALPADYIAHSIHTYAQRAIHLQWDFLFPYYGVGGPNFLISFLPIGVTLSLLTVTTLLLIALIRSRRARLFLVTCILAVGLAFTLLVDVEFLFHDHHPDIERASRELIDIYNHEIPSSHKPRLHLPTTLSGTLFHLQGTNLPNTTYLNHCKQSEPTCFDDLAESLHGASVLYLDYPKLADDNPRKQVITQNCESFKTITSKGIPIAEAYTCP